MSLACALHLALDSEFYIDYNSRYPEKKDVIFCSKKPKLSYRKTCSNTERVLSFQFLYEHTTLVAWHFILFFLVSSVALNWLNTL